MLQTILSNSSHKKGISHKNLFRSISSSFMNLKKYESFTRELDLTAQAIWDNGIRSISIHGIIGVGKTEVAKCISSEMGKYLELDFMPFYENVHNNHYLNLLYEDLDKNYYIAQSGIFENTVRQIHSSTTCGVSIFDTSYYAQIAFHNAAMEMGYMNSIQTRICRETHETFKRKWTRWNKRPIHDIIIHMQIPIDLAIERMMERKIKEDGIRSEEVKIPRIYMDALERGYTLANKVAIQDGIKIGVVDVGEKDNISDVTIKVINELRDKINNNA